MSVSQMKFELKSEFHPTRGKKRVFLGGTGDCPRAIKPGAAHPPHRKNDTALFFFFVTLCPDEKRGEKEGTSLLLPPPSGTPPRKRFCICSL